MISKHIKCDNCGQEFDIDFERSYVFCEYCGCKIELENQPEPQNNEIKTEFADTSTQPEQAFEPQYQAIPQAETIPESRPDPQPVAAPASDPVIKAPEPENKLPEAIRCYNTCDYAGANEILETLKKDDPENFEVWFCCCKVIAAEQPDDIKTAFEKYTEAAEKCVSCAPAGIDVKGNITLDFNRLIKTVNDTIIAKRLFIAPYDRSVMSEAIPSFNYQPLSKVDEYYYIIMDGIKAFQDRINPDYSTNYFLSVWDSSFFCFAHDITQKMVFDLDNCKFFQWYRTDLANRVTNDTIYKALCDVIYAYKNVFINLFNRLPYRDTKTTAYTKIAFLNKWLLKLKRTDQYGRTYLLIAQPADRSALEQEIRNYRIMLDQA